MNILLISDSYPPEIRSASKLMQELAHGLEGHGHRVTVVTCYPGYNLTEAQKRIHYPVSSSEDGIRVVRVRTLQHHKVGFVFRGIAQLALPMLFHRAIRKYVHERIDAVIVYSPPLTLAKVGWKVKKRSHSIYILNVQDIFPQNAIDLGIMKNRLVIRFFERLEKRMYRKADSIVVHSHGNREYLTGKKHLPEKKVHVVYNWIDVSQYDRVTPTGRFRKQYALQNKLVFLFGGVIGPSQCLEVIIRVAEKLKDYPDICFLLVGDGTEKPKLIDMADSLGLKNISFKPFVAMNDYPELVKEADVGLVCLSPENRTPVVPGKILAYMASKIPVAAFLNRESDGHGIISDAGCGATALSKSEDEVRGVIMSMYNQEKNLKRMGENGYRYLLKHFEKSVCLEKLEAVLKRQ
jgi:colanic acid biosynthesis glycosyl transferase WcaI